MKHPRNGWWAVPGVLHCRDANNSEFDDTTPLTLGAYLRRSADDFKPGSHLEVGELEQRRRITLGKNRGHGYCMTLRPESLTGRAALIHETDRSSWPIKVSGVSEYPAPESVPATISRAEMGR